MITLSVLTNCNFFYFAKILFTIFSQNKRALRGSHHDLKKIKIAESWNCSRIVTAKTEKNGTRRQLGSDNSQFPNFLLFPLFSRGDQRWQRRKGANASEWDTSSTSLGSHGASWSAVTRRSQSQCSCWQRDHVQVTVHMLADM